MFTSLVTLVKLSGPTGQIWSLSWYHNSQSQMTGVFGYEYLNLSQSSGERKRRKDKKMAEAVSQSILWKLIWKYLEGSIEKYPAMSID